MNRRFDDSIINYIIKFWPIILSVIGLISMIAIMQSTLRAHSGQLDQNAQDHKIINAELAQLKSQLSLLPEMRSDIKSLLRRERRRD